MLAASRPDLDSGYFDELSGSSNEPRTSDDFHSRMNGGLEAIELLNNFSYSGQLYINGVMVPLLRLSFGIVLYLPNHCKYVLEEANACAEAAFGNFHSALSNGSWIATLRREARLAGE